MFHPIFTALVRRHQASRYAAANGLSFGEALSQMRAVPTEDFNASCLQAQHDANVDLPAEVFGHAHFANGAVGAAFDGHILQELIAWFKSPQGQAFLAILEKILAILIPLLIGT